MKKLVVFVPKKHAEAVKEALFSAGAGTYKHYSHCCFQTLGLGQFKPCESAQPFLGTRGVLEYVEEVKVEMLCEDALIAQALKHMKNTHPYEAPAYEVSTVEDWGA